MNYCEIGNEKVSVDELFKNYYKKYEKRIRKVNMDEEWIKEMLEETKWKYIM